MFCKVYLHSNIPKQFPKAPLSGWGYPEARTRFPTSRLRWNMGFAAFSKYINLPNIGQVKIWSQTINKRLNRLSFDDPWNTSVWMPILLDESCTSVPLLQVQMQLVPSHVSWAANGGTSTLVKHSGNMDQTEIILNAPTTFYSYRRLCTREPFVDTTAQASSPWRCKSCRKVPIEVDRHVFPLQGLSHCLSCMDLHGHALPTGPFQVQVHQGGLKSATNASTASEPISSPEGSTETKPSRIA